MSLGAIIAARRKELNLSQEQLADKLTVSRSAVAKWETDKGMPDIDNIKAISRELNISIDILLNNKSDSMNEDLNIKSDSNNKNDTDSNQNHCDKRRYEKMLKFISKKCTIELTDWNDGIYDGYLLNYDGEFLYYIISNKRNIKVGMLAEQYVTDIRVSTKKNSNTIDLSNYSGINSDFFIGKKTNLYLNEKHIWNGIIGKKTEYLNVSILTFANDHLVIESDNLLSDITIPVRDIAKIEVI